ncbi:30S ribosome-binding factor RbfA [bacterium]|nr:30S ribosome-binding factor RbfA [bacterium]
MKQRARRIAEMIQREIGQIINFEMRDPRMKNLTITGVQLSDDLGYAKIYYVTAGTDAELKQIKETLVHAQGFLRTKIGERIDMKYVPQIKFFFDESIAHSARMDELFKEIKTGE